MMRKSIFSSVLLAGTLLGLSACGGGSSSSGSDDSSILNVGGGDNGGSNNGGGSTPPQESSVRFILMGDSGNPSDGAYAVGKAMAAVCEVRGCDLVLGLGDNIYDAGVTSVMDPQFEEKFELPFEPVDLPFYFVLGNHDNTGFFGGDGAGNATGQYQVDYHYRDVEHPEAPRLSKRWKMPDRFYKISQGQQANGKPLVEFFGIDSSQIAGGFPDSDENYSYNSYGLQQAKWLKEGIDKSQAKWKFVFAHHPYVSNGRHGNAGNYDGVPSFLLPVLAGERYKAFLEETMCDRADFMFAGHDHDLQWLMSQSDCGKTEFILSGAASKTRSLENRNNNPVFYEKGDTYGFVWVEVKGDQFYGEVYEVDPNDGALGIGSLSSPQPVFTRSTLQQPSEGIVVDNDFTNPLNGFDDSSFDVYGQEGNLDDVQSNFASSFAQLAAAVDDPAMASLINAMAQSSIGLIEVLDALATGVQQASEEQNPDLIMAGSARASQALLYSLQQLQAVVDSNENLPAPFDQLGAILDEFRASAPSADDQISGDASADLRSLTDPVKALAMNIQGLVDAIEEEAGIVPVVGGTFSLLSDLLLDVGRTLDAVGNASTSELGQVVVSMVENLLNNILVGVIPIEQFAPPEVTQAIGLGPKFLSSVLLAVVREVTFALDNTLMVLLAPLLGALDQLLITPLLEGLAGLANLEF